MSGLRLLAADAADLDVMSAAVQDALLRARDFFYEPRTRRFSAQLQRFRWESAGERGPYERVVAALSFDSVLDVKTRRLRRDAPDAFAQILSLKFDADETPPGGTLRIMLAGDGEVALTVECLDATLVDIGEPWRTQRRPDHEEQSR